MLDKSTVMLGTSAAMRAIEREIDVAAGCSAKVLITGESGVGKELVARLIHEGSARRANKFVAINCAGLPDSLLESELFGHVRGSFTGAYRDKKGWLEAAHGGTIFLDEVGEMSLRMQAMLLRFLETGEIQRVGSERPLPPLDVRVIAATHRNLAECVKDRTFREDLYYRLNVVHIEVPPLRDRRGDIPVLLNHFLSMFSSAHRLPLPEVAADALQRLATYDWPGNVRELKNVAERLVVGSRSGRIETTSLPADMLARTAAPRRRRRLARPRRPRPARPDESAALDRLMKERVSFWSEVHEPFMNHDITREDVRELVREGLAHTRGNYKMLVRAFNMDPRDYKRFLSFLRTYECHVSFRPFRMMADCADEASAADGVRLMTSMAVQWRLARRKTASVRFARVSREGRFEFDRAYLDRLASGDPETERHFTRYFGDLLSIKLRSRLRSPAQVEDARQETFLRVMKALRQPGGIQSPGGFGAFVNSVCNNVLFEMYRSHSRDHAARGGGRRRAARSRRWMPRPQSAWTRTGRTCAP